MALSIGIATIGMYFVFINQYLADKLGRKFMLFITTLGMGISALLFSLSQNIIQFTIFLFLTYLFFSSDLWLIYINEESEPEKRAFNTNIIAAISIVGTLLIPIFRSIFITETSPVGSWRGMTLFPIFLGIPLAIIIFFTIKETSNYQEIKKDKSLRKSIFLKDNIKALFKSDHRKEFIVLLIMSYFTGLNFIMLQLFESFISTSTDLTESHISIIILIVVVSLVVGYITTGIIADKIGRVPLLYIFSILLPVATIFLFIGSNLSANIFIIITISIALGYVAYTGLLILLRIIIMEIIPTDKRGTGTGIRALATALGITSGFVIGSIITLYYGLGMAFLIISLPLIINVLLIHKYIKETQGTDLREIK
jgi:MFS family permease